MGFQFQLPKIKAPKLDMEYFKPNSREPVSAKIKNEVRKRAKNKCEKKGCNYRKNLQFHHIDFNNRHNTVKNIMLLCPNHHIEKHKKSKVRRVYHRNVFGVVTGSSLKNKSKKKRQSNQIPRLPDLRF